MTTSRYLFDSFFSSKVAEETPPPVSEPAPATLGDFVKQARMRCVGRSLGRDEGWLERYTGTPLFDQALALEQQSLQQDAMEAEQDSRLEQAKKEIGYQDWDALRTQRDQVALQRDMLDLQLAQYRNSELAAAGGAGMPGPAQGDPLPPSPGAPAPAAPAPELSPAVQKVASLESSLLAALRPSMTLGGMTKSARAPLSVDEEQLLRADLMQEGARSGEAWGAVGGGLGLGALAAIAGGSVAPKGRGWEYATKAGLAGGAVGAAGGARGGGLAGAILAPRYATRGRQLSKVIEDAPEGTALHQMVSDAANRGDLHERAILRGRVPDSDTPAPEKTASLMNAVKGLNWSGLRSSAGQIARGAATPALIGAGVGAVGGAATAGPNESMLGAAAKGAVGGGLVAGGAKALHSAGKTLGVQSLFKGGPGAAAAAPASAKAPGAIPDLHPGTGGPPAPSVPAAPASAALHPQVPDLQMGNPGKIPPPSQQVVPSLAHGDTMLSQSSPSIVPSADIKGPLSASRPPSAPMAASGVRPAPQRLGPNDVTIGSPAAPAAQAAPPSSASVPVHWDTQPPSAAATPTPKRDIYQFLRDWQKSRGEST